MKVDSSGAAGSPWYDRGLQTLTKRMLVTTGPHGSVMRMNYIVPAGRNFKIYAIQLSARRTQLATSPGRVMMSLEVDPLVGGLQEVLKETSFLNSIEELLINRVFTDFLLVAGEELQFRTQDTGVDSLVEYLMTLLGALYFV